MAEEMVVLIKGPKEEVLGGISVDVQRTNAYISRFWLNPQIRGFSFGSILLHEVIRELQKTSIRQLLMGTHIQYIKHILRNNRFERYDEYTVQHRPYSFYRLRIDAIQPLAFTHPYTCSNTPTPEERDLFYTLYEKGPVETYDVLKPCYLQVNEGDEPVGIIAAFRNQKLLFIDQVTYYTKGSLENRLLKPLNEFAQSLSIDALYYMNGFTKKLEHDHANFSESLQFA